MTIFRYTISWIFICLVTIWFSTSTVHFIILQQAVSTQAKQDFNAQVTIAELSLDTAYTDTKTLSAIDINSVLSGILSNTSLTFIQVMPEGEDTSYRQQLNDFNDFPTWFVTLANLTPLTTARKITVNQDNVIHINLEASIHPQLEVLWQSTLQFNTITVLCFILVFSLLALMIKRKNRSLVFISARAKDILNNQPYSPLLLPSDKDTKLIATAMNHLYTQLDSHFKLQATEAIKLKEQAYRDKVSGLGNRHYFINQLNTWIASSPKGGVALLKTTLIDDTYQKYGFDHGDSLVKQIAEELNSNIIHSEVSLARLSYDEFAVLAPNTTASKLKSIGESMLTVLNKIQAQSGNNSPDCAHVGLVLAERANNASHILAQLDNVLAQAALTPESPLAFTQEPATDNAFGKQQWKALLIEAIDNDLFQYQYQPVSSDQGVIFHYEVFTAINKDSKKYSANLFLGAIEDLGAGMLFDREVIANSINRLNADSTLGPLAINITNNSVSDPSFIRWLSEIMDRNQRLSERIFFEIPEASFVRTPDSCSLLCSAIRFYKFRFGVDNYGRYFNSLDYLTEFRPDYVKIDFSYTHQLNDEAKKTLLSSISRSAHSLNIVTIATRVETETQLERLADLFVSGFQGYIVEKKCSRLNQPA
ncbi:GGDEF domain-containing protein [Photobacterium makurazakiensis]|uniref:EAL domain-containing protein n=1 Tax=Photobacterium makurazakiensis TaxID=2910234 RepID=UPI003D0CF8CC